MKTLNIIDTINKAIDDTFEVGDILLAVTVSYYSDNDETGVPSIFEEPNEEFLFVLIVGSPLAQDEFRSLTSILHKIGNSKTYRRSNMKKFLVNKYKNIENIDEILEEIEEQINS